MPLDHEVAALLVALYADCSRSTDGILTSIHTSKTTTLTDADARFCDRKQRARPPSSAQASVAPRTRHAKGGLTPLTKEVARACEHFRRCGTFVVGHWIRPTWGRRLYPDYFSKDGGRLGRGSRGTTSKRYSNKRIGFCSLDIVGRCRLRPR